MGRSIREQFINPDNSERGMPFWAWNTKVTPELLESQLPYFENMGMGGFVIHSRTGMAVPYLGEEFMGMVKHCVERAKADDLSVILYDEDRWPSGFGGGMITKEETYRARYLVFSKWADGRMPEEVEYLRNGRLDVRPWGGGKLLCCFRVYIEAGFLKGYEILDEVPASEKEGDNIWYLHEERMHADPWFNNQTYMDTLNPAAVERLIKTTYEQYEKTLGDAFGTIARAMFTDEPQFIHKHFWKHGDQVKWAVLPYSDQFETMFQEVFQTPFLTKVPELFWDRADQNDKSVRYEYHCILLECFAAVYCDTLGQWCKDHGIALTGHMKGEGTLALQAGSIGEAMRNYRNFQIPGIDMLCDKREYTTAKQAQSVARQMGRGEVMSELYGVTNWDFDFKGHKLQGDWQAALGVTLRVPHLAWASMEGEAKRDFPASIFYQSPWYEQYHHLETYFARINTVMKTGLPVVHVAVIHPIESFWLDFGTENFAGKRLEQLEKQFQELAEWLLFGGVDFDYISEALLGQQEVAGGKGKLVVGEMTYQAVIVPGLHTMRSNTLYILESYQAGGGFLMFAGDFPEYIDGKHDCRVAGLAETSVKIPFLQNEILSWLVPFQNLKIQHTNGKLNDKYLYQLRRSENGYSLFLANGRDQSGIDSSEADNLSISIHGRYKVEQWNPMDGTIEPIPANYDLEQGQMSTRIDCQLFAQDSLLLRFYEVEQASLNLVWDAETESKDPQLTEGLQLMESLPITTISLSEPNVLLLDQAEYRLNHGPKVPKEEVLRIENIIRKQLGYPLKTESFAQPWIKERSRESQETCCHQVELWYTFQSECAFESLELAIENPAEKEIWWNGTLCKQEVNGWYVDTVIKKCTLGNIKPGKNELYIKQPFHHQSNLEWCYLLGDFSIKMYKEEVILREQNKELEYGDITKQGLMFYGGNVEYSSELELEPGVYILEVHDFAAPVLAVELDGEFLGIIAFAPYQIKLGNLAGRHHIRIIAYGNRFNTFGALHNCKAGETWFGPSAWRTIGADFTYGYQVRPAGILKAPVLYRISLVSGKSN